MDAPNRPDCEKLLAQARAGRNDSLGALLDLYRGHLQALAGVQIHGRLRARVNPSDLVQETFLKASQHFDEFRGTTEQELVAWLRTILRRSLLSTVQQQVSARKRSIQREIDAPRAGNAGWEEARDLPTSLVSPGSSPSAAFERRELAGQINERLSRLPPSFREVIVLRNLEGLPFPDVARRMKRTPGAVRILWLRALEKLREQCSATDLI